MDQEQPFSLPNDVLDAAILYVKEKYEVFLHRGDLVEMYEALLKHRKEMAELAKEDPTLAGADSFEAALEFVLDGRLSQQDEREQQIYKAHESAIGKIAAGLKARGKKQKKPQEQKKKTSLERLKGRVVYDPNKPQARFAF